jgi:hypothetical protein
MKKIFLIAAIAIGLSFSSTLTAQSPPHPNGGNAPNTGGTTNGPVGGGAPVGNGTFILFALALAYAGRKVYVMRRTAEE